MDEVHATGPDDRLGRLLDAVLAVASDLTLPVVLQRIVESARTLANAQYAALGVIGPDGRLSEFLTAGIDQAARDRIGPLPEGHGLLGALVVDPRPVRLRDLGTDPRSSGFPANHPPMHSFLGVPIIVRDRVFGNLYLTEKLEGDEFSEQDESLVVALAAAAGAAVENARLHARVQDLAVIEDRERIARDLHDTVIQRLFATGMSLQAASRFVDDPDVEGRIKEAIDDLDQTIREIRGTIFALTNSRRNGLRAEVLGVAAEASSALGFVPTIHFEGPVDSVVPDDIAEHLVSCLREALSNVARHARAHKADVLVSVGADVVLRVLDDGVGIGQGGPSDGGRGLRNLEERADGLGGLMALQSRPGGGTAFEWRVPLGT